MTSKLIYEVKFLIENVQTEGCVDRYKAIRVLDAVEIDRVSTLPRATSQTRKSDRVSETSDARRCVSISLRYSR